MFSVSRFSVGKKCAGTTLVFSLALLFMVSPAVAQQFATIDPPGTTGTFPGGINDLGQVVGAYFDASGVEHCFLFSGGVYSTIDFPGATGTACAGINNVGQIVGSYLDSSQLSHGFLLNNGTFSTIDDPAFTQGNFLAQISDTGFIAGDGIDSSGVFHGFTFTNNVFKTVNYPGANFTEILDMSFNGTELAGAYSLPSFPAQTTQGFTEMNGTFTSVTYPGSASSVLNGVTNVGLLVGTYSLANQSGSHGFLLNGTTYTSFDFPGAASTGVANINDLGQVVGGYTDNSNVTHGFLMTNGPFAYAPVRSANSVAVFDLATGLPVPSIPVGSGPIAMAVSPLGTTAYVGNYQANTVSAINTTNNSVTATIPVGSSPLGVAITPDGSLAYVANNFSNNVSVISTASNTVVATVPVGSIPSFVAITPDGKFAYVSNQGSPFVSVINTASNTVVASVAIGLGQVGLAATPDDKSVYATVPGTNSVAVISTATNTVVNTIPVGSAPVRVSITPDGTTAYVSNQGSDLVTVINVPTGTVLTNVVVGTTPYGSAPTPDGSSEWVIDAGSGQISVISTSTNTVLATLSLGGGSDIAIGPGAPMSVPVTQPLSPTAPNDFNFPTNNMGIQYPSGSNFNNILMTVDQVEITQAQYSQRVAGGQFANSTCIVYSGAGGNCIDYQVTCTQNGVSVACPAATAPIDVETEFTTAEGIVNPAYLQTPLGQNNWTNIFAGLSDTLIKGKTQGFPASGQVFTGSSEFVAVNLGSTNSQGVGTLQAFMPKVCSTVTCKQSLPVYIRITAANGSPITGAQASISALRVADGNGNPVQSNPLTKTDAFVATSTPGVYACWVNLSKFPAGTYNVTIYGDSFAAKQYTLKLVQ